MGFFDRFRGRKPSKRPHRLVFEAENPDNGYITFESKCKPRVHVEDSFPQEVYQALSAREGEMIQALEEIWPSGTAGAGITGSRTGSSGT